MQPGDTYIADSTVLDAEDAHATLVGNEPLDPTIQEIIRSSGEAIDNTTRKGEESTPTKKSK